MKIKEVIVVEGKDDVAAIKRAIDTEVIITHGYGISEETYSKIISASKRCGIIIFTDPDYAGETIRKKISARVEHCKHAFLSKEDATLNGDIGIENASPENILSALSKAHAAFAPSKNEFSQYDLVENRLVGSTDSRERRTHLGKILGIGYSNSKSLLHKLNHYDISREEFNTAISKLSR